MPPQGPRGNSAVIGIPLGCLLVIAITVPEFGGVLIPTMGIVVVAAALFLTPRQTMIVAAAAILTAVGVAVATDTNFKPYRIGNVVLASLLGVAASWALELRVRHLTRAKQTQARVFETVPEGLVVLDNDGRVELANPAMQTYAPGVTEGEPLHRLLGHVLADGSMCAGGCTLDDPGSLQADEPVQLVEDERFLTPDGERWIEYYAARVDDTTTVISLRDVTSIIEAERSPGTVTPFNSEDLTRKSAILSPPLSRSLAISILPPISSRVVMRPVRVGFISTLGRVTSLSGTISAATMGKAAEDGSEGT